MRPVLFSSLSLGGGALLALAFGACSSGSSNNPPPPDGGGPTTLAYTPQGCAYTKTIDGTHGETDLAADDATAAGQMPARLRIGLGGNTTAGQPGYPDPTTTAAFTWETTTATHAAKVRFGTSPGSFTQTQAGYSWTLPAPESGFGSGDPPAFFHEAHVCGLSPGTTYYYQVGGGTPEVWSATQSFATLPASGKVTIGVIGDSRDQADVLTLTQLRMRDAGVAMQLFSGDLVFVGVQESLYAKWLDAMWKDPADATKPLALGQMPIVAMSGNHEGDSPPFFSNWSLPGDETYGSFDVGSAHVAFFDETRLSVKGATDPAVAAQLAWLDQDLAKADANRAAHPFLVTMNHFSIVSSGKHATDDDVLEARAALLPVFDKYHVDLVINGHDHFYERTFPVKPAPNPRDTPIVQTPPATGMVVMVSAGSGAIADPVGGTLAFDQSRTLFGPGTPYVGTYSIMTLDAHTLHVDSYGLTAAGKTVKDDGAPIDTFDLQR